MKLGDDTLRLTHRPNDRVTIEMGKASLKQYLDRPNDDYWDFEKKQVKGHICSLKAKLNEAQVKKMSGH